MPDKIVLRDHRNAVDKVYVGFPPNGSSIKPVHIASGALRTIYGAYNTTINIKRLALVSDSKGHTPTGNEIDTIFDRLLEDESIEDSVSIEALDSMRSVMQKLLSVDKGVYIVSGLKDGMISYSAGSKFFLTKHAMYEDAGEFIGSVIKTYCPELANHISKILNEAKDPISLLFKPVLEEDMETFESNRHEDIPAFNGNNAVCKWFVDGVRASGTSLKNSLEQHANPLTQLRLFNFYCIFQIIRYMALLEAFYCNENIRPILLDFTGKAPSQSSVARASEMSYTQLYKSLNRFYAWAYANEFENLSRAEMLQSETPVYEVIANPSKAKKEKTSKDELDALWAMAKERASGTETDDDLRLVFGETAYDMLALEASSNPVIYIKALGTAAGILYPPDKSHPNKRFVLSQDVLEMLLRCCVNPEEVLSGAELRARLWDRFGIIIGGSNFEIDKLQKSGMILQVDEDSLEENFSDFASIMEAMDFAEEMADGILQIRFGGKA